MQVHVHFVEIGKLFKQPIYYISKITLENVALYKLLLGYGFLCIYRKLKMYKTSKLEYLL